MHECYVVVACRFRQIARAEQVRAEDRHRSQRHHQGCNQREADRQREGQEKGPNEALDEPEWNKHHDGGQRRGENGRPYFHSGVQRRPPAFTPCLNVAVDVLQHHNRVVHHPAHGNRQAAQGHEIQRHVLPGHEQHAGENAQRNGERNHDGRPKGIEHSAYRCGPEAQHEYEDDRHGEQEPVGRLAQQRVDLFLYFRTLVGNGDNFDRRGKLGEAVQCLPHAVGHFDGVGLGVLYNGYADGWLAVSAGDAGRRSFSEDDPGNVGQHHRPGRRRAHNQFPEVFNRIEGVGGLDRDRLACAENQAGRDGQVVLAESGGHLGQ